jgi:TonB family protein
VILNWMLASVLFALVLAGAGMLGERAAASAAGPRRLPWGFALAAATLWPLMAGLWVLVQPVEPTITRITTRISSGAPQALAVQLPIGASMAEMIDSALLITWMVASLAIVARITFAVLRMRAVTRDAEPMSLDETSVLVSESAGPAVSGFWNPRIVVPRWLLELDAPLRAVVLRHEREHVARGDSAVMLGAAVATALTPWNPAVWWMARRLRLAVELDCDARVLAARENPERYGRLLMLVAQRQAHARLAPMLAESNADLEWRIGTMNEPSQKRSPARAVVFGGVAAGLALLAFTSPVMAGVRKPSVAVRAITAAVSAPALGATSLQSQQGQVKPPQPPPKQAARPLPAPPPPPKADSPAAAKPAQEGYFEFTVTRQATEAERTQRPRYPDILRSAGLEGVVVAQFVVHNDGTVDTGSLKVLRATHALFEASVRTALPEMRFTPAMVQGRAVRQLIEQTFEFNMADSDRITETFWTDSARVSQVHKVTKVVITASRPPQ